MTQNRGTAIEQFEAVFLQAEADGVKELEFNVRPQPSNRKAIVLRFFGTSRNMISGIDREKWRGVSYLFAEATRLAERHGIRLVYTIS